MCELWYSVAHSRVYLTVFLHDSVESLDLKMKLNLPKYITISGGMG